MNTSLAEALSDNETDTFNGTRDIDSYYNYGSEGYDYYYYLMTIADIAARRSPELRMLAVITYKYLMPITWVISLLGNSLIVCVLMMKKNRGHSMSVYLTSLAVADLGVNTNNNMVVFFAVHGYVPPPMSDIDCLNDVFSFAIIMIAAWMLVMVSLERFVIVFSPIKGKHYCTVKLARIVSVSVWMIFFALALAYRIIFFEHVQLTIDIHMCLIKTPLVDLHADVISYIFMALKFFIPYVLIFATTTFIIYNLLNRKIRKSSSHQGKDNSVNVVLIIINFIYLVTQFPYTFLYLMKEDLLEGMSLLDQFVYYQYWLPLAIFVGDLNSAANVFVYFLTGSRFRNDTIEMLSGLTPERFKKLPVRKPPQTPDDGSNTKSTVVQITRKEKSSLSQKESLHM